MDALSAVGKKTVKRDTLVAIEKRIQKLWAEERIFEVNAPAPGSPEAAQPKHMVSFPYPYMNGRLHLGHSFSLSKCEFSAGYEMLQGKRVLFPFGFHCTGMPIKACADKLRREIEMYGNPPVFPEEDEVADDEIVEQTTAAAGGNQIMKKKSKVAAKSTGKKYQWQIMESMGVDVSEIAKFADPKHWLYYFPPRAQEDLIKLGVKVDWRRSFITTDVNPYYDSFVRWQFNTLKAAGKIKYGKRYTIYSPLDNQACMDHDRQSGEGVVPQEYTLIKLKLQSPFPESLKHLEGHDVFLTAATLRPETMYGQTNCFVGPSLMYGAFKISDKEVFVCTDRAALNLSYQGFTGANKEGKVDKVASVSGKDLVGCSVNAPLSKYANVYVLPMDGVLANKGTGVVTSVPSDSPDDFATLMELKKKAAYYKIKDEWVQPYDPVPTILTPSFGDMAAVKVCQEMKISSPKDRKQLDMAKEKVYKEGFYSGTMINGDFAGKSVQEAKPLIRQQLIAEKLACAYYEPESLVMSRSGDECVVCLTDQWYLNYGEPSWKAQAVENLERMNVFHEEVRNSFVKCLDWLKEWACSRSFGLGSRLPWDQQFLIESLSDSTIYMALYTVAHFLQGERDGSKSGLCDIKPEQLTDDVWSYFFNNSIVSPPKSSGIPDEVLLKIKNEFKYFYPLDLRVSGKDLITNHLTFFIYNHVAIFEKENWPLSIRANGHLLINSEKMSKSTGNFMTLSESVDKFSADGTRFALAEAGDGIDDANFDCERANAAILKLFYLKEWIDEVRVEAKEGKLRTGPADTFNDRVFMNDMNILVKNADNAYKNMLYYDAVKFSFHELLNARDRYKLVAQTIGSPPHVDVIDRYIRVQALIMAPIIPHFSEFIWRDVLGNTDSIMHARWPKLTGEVDANITATKLYVDHVLREARLAIISETQPKKKKGNMIASTEPIVPPKAIKFFIASDFPEWQTVTVGALKDIYDSSNQTLPDLKSLTRLLSRNDATKSFMKNKKYMPFVKDVVDGVAANGPSGFNRTLPFEEKQVLETNLEFIRLSLGMNSLEICTKDSFDQTNELESQRIESAQPGVPTFLFDP